MDNETIVALHQQLYNLRQEHRETDESIQALLLHPYIDQLQMVRLKKRKLRLKEQIAHLENQLIPDLNA